VATRDEGIDAMLSAVESFRSAAEKGGVLLRKRRANLLRQLEDTLAARMLGRARERVMTQAETERILDRLAAREVDPLTAADEVLGRMGL